MVTDDDEEDDHEDSRDPVLRRHAVLRVQVGLPVHLPGLRVPVRRRRKCRHEEFETWAEISRLTDSEGGPVTGYAADIRIRCAGCQVPLVTRGLLRGVSPGQPTMSVLGDELRVPYEIAGDALAAMVLGSADGSWWPGETASPDVVQYITDIQEKIGIDLAELSKLPPDLQVERLMRPVRGLDRVRLAAYRDETGPRAGAGTLDVPPPVPSSPSDGTPDDYDG